MSCHNRECKIERIGKYLVTPGVWKQDNAGFHSFHSGFGGKEPLARYSFKTDQNLYFIKMGIKINEATLYESGII